MLADIVGQEYVVGVLRNTLAQDHTNGSFLFLGPAHSGKTTTAVEFAKALLCESPRPSPDSCGECVSCRMVDENTHPDLRSVRPAGPSNILRIPQIWPREGVKDFPAHAALLRDIQFGPVRGKHRIFIIEGADAFHEDTANSLLKMLEEPPPYATFILTALGQSSVLPTILSRCQVIRFQSVPSLDIEELIVNRGIADRDKARFAAIISQRQVGVALAVASDFHSLSARDTINQIAAELSENQIPVKALKLADDLRKSSAKLSVASSDTNGSSAEGSSTRLCSVAGLEMLAAWYRDLIATATGASSDCLVNSDQAEKLSEIAAKSNPNTFLDSVDIVLAIRDAVERNANAQIAFEALALRLAALQAA